MRSPVLLVAMLAAVPLFAQSSPSSLGAAPDTLAVRHLETRPAPDPLPGPRWGSAAVVFRGKLYLFGGFDGNHWLPDALTLDAATGHWIALAPMPQSNLGLFAAVAGNRIVIGETNAETGATYLYDPSANSWSRGPPLVHGRAGPQLIAFGRRVFATGGVDGAGNGVAAIETLIRGRWVEEGFMPFLRASPAAAVLNGKIYFAGGYDSTPGDHQRRFREMEEYDPASREWRSLAPMPTERVGAGAAVLDGRIYVAGGDHSMLAPSLSVVEVYDPAANSWSTAPPMPQPRRFAAAAVLDGRFYMLGGSPLTQSASNTVQIYDPGTRQWSVSGDASPAVSPPPSARFVAAPAAPAPSPRYEPKSPEHPHDFALVIGIGNYKGLPPAEFAESDARDMAAALGALGVPEENVVSLTGSKATLSEISKYVEEWLPRRVSKDSRVYFYFSGHGSPDVKDGSAYMMPWDADAAFVKSTGFPLSRLYTALGDLPARHVIALIDSCFSGAGGRSVLVAGTRPLVAVRLPADLSPRISVLTASESEEIAGSLPERGHGLFSYYALRGLAGEADVEGTGHVTLEQLYAYVHKHVILDARRQNREQTPTLTSPTPKLRLY